MSNGVFSNLVIRASAGTGKTFQLSNRYIALLAADAPPEQILATTFTRKAAGEILDRIVTRLATAASDDAARKELSAFIHAELSQPRCIELLRRLLRNLHRLHVGTLDSFFARLARGLSLEVGLPAAWRIIDEIEDGRLRDQAIGSVIDGESADDLLTLVHLMTKGETTRGVGQLVRATVNDLIELYQSSARDAWYALPRPAPLDTNAVAELAEELRELQTDGKRMSSARTADLSRVITGDWEGFIGKGIGAKVAAGEEKFASQPIPDDFLPIYRQLVEHARAVLVARVAQQTEGAYQLLDRFDDDYQRLKQNQLAARFDDVTRRLASAITTLATEGNRRLEQRMDSQIQHLLLDEFQDTSPLQWNVLNPFAERVTAADGRSFFCVGDTKQAIYSWRGGVAEIFDAVTSALPNLEVEQLTASYRSSQVVIGTVNRVFDGVVRHSNLEGTEQAVRRWRGRYDVHETKRDDLDGHATLTAAPDKDSLLSFAADRVVSLHQESPRHGIGVLVRTNDSVRRLVKLLNERGIVASEEGGNPLTDSVAVQLILSLLTLADHPSDTIVRFHLAHSPLGAALGLSDWTDTEAALQLSKRLRRELLERGYGAAMGRWRSLLAECGSPREQLRLDQLVEMAFSYEPRATLRADDFVRFVERQKVSDPTSANVRVMTIHQAKGLEFDIVVLPELGGPLVGQPPSFVVHRQDPTQPVDRVCRYVNADLQRLLPPRFQKMFEQTTERVVEESLCVLYVGLTRAIHALHMIIPPASAKEKKLPRTAGGLLRVALTEDGAAEPGELLYEAGDADWHRRQSADSAGELETTTNAPPPTIRLAEATGRRRGLTRTAPSSLEGGSQVRLSEVLQAARGDAMLAGTIVHAWFEQIQWLDGYQIDRALFSQVARRELAKHATSDFDVERLLDTFVSSLGRPAIVEVLSQQQYRHADALGYPDEIARRLSSSTMRLSVSNERRFAYREKNQLVSGTVDRLVLLHDGDAVIAADVIDFKTDRVVAQQIPERTDFYRPQLQSYRRAVAALTGLPEQAILARLVFVGPAEVSRL